MSEHLIRLRAAWTLRVGEQARRIDLPTSVKHFPVVPFCLVRAFGRPPLKVDTESLRLRLEDVPGLKTIRVNGVPVRPLDGSVPGRLELDLDSPARRFVLELEVDPTDVPDAWGRIALVVRSIGGTGSRDL